MHSAPSAQSLSQSIYDRVINQITIAIEQELNLISVVPAILPSESVLAKIIAYMSNFTLNESLSHELRYEENYSDFVNLLNSLSIDISVDQQYFCDNFKDIFWKQIKDKYDLDFTIEGDLVILNNFSIDTPINNENTEPTDIAITQTDTLLYAPNHFTEIELGIKNIKDLASWILEISEMTRQVNENTQSVVKGIIQNSEQVKEELRTNNIRHLEDSNKLKSEISKEQEKKRKARSALDVEKGKRQRAETKLNETQSRNALLTVENQKYTEQVAELSHEKKLVECQRDRLEVENIRLKQLVLQLTQEKGEKEQEINKLLSYTIKLNETIYKKDARILQLETAGSPKSKPRSPIQTLSHFSTAENYFDFDSNEEKDNNFQL